MSLLKTTTIITGKNVILKELSPDFFKEIIEWRNNTDLNKYLNQPNKLTLEGQNKWYFGNYVNDDTQMLYVMIDKKLINLLVHMVIQI